MKTNRLLGIAIPLLACLLQIMALAQGNLERDIVSKFQNGQASGMKVTILLSSANGALTPVDPKREFQPGEEIKVLVESNLRGYLYLVNFGASGKNSVVFPDARAGESHLLQPFRRYIIPASYPIGFDENTGTEVFRVFLSSRPIGFLETAVRKNNGVLSQQQADDFARLSTMGAEKQFGVVSTPMALSNKPGATQPLDTRDPVWNDEKKTSLVVIRRKNGTGERLRPGEVAVFGINFKNRGAAK